MPGCLAINISWLLFNLSFVLMDKSIARPLFYFVRLRLNSNLLNHRRTEDTEIEKKYSGMHLNEIQNLPKKLYTIISFNSVTVA